jgi:hypothetical protein
MKRFWRRFQRSASGIRLFGPLSWFRSRKDQIIFKLGAEGGTLTLMGIKAANGWRFRTVTDESILFDLLNEGDRKGLEFKHQSDWVDSLDSALKR